MKKLVIAASAKFQDEIKYWKEYFIEKGYDVINYPKKINQEDIEEYKNAHFNFFKSMEIKNFIKLEWIELWNIK